MAGKRKATDPIDVKGDRYGMLVALRRADKKTKGGGYYWYFQCECGRTVCKPLNSVRSGLIKSCGCLRHHKTGTRLYNIWVAMRQRCKNDGKHWHDRWGNRGISVCDEWNDFRTFEKWALENGYEDNLTIDRIDNNGNYCPENCRWATYKEQSLNTSANRFVEIDGESRTVEQWCCLLGVVTPSTVYRRVRKAGWSFQKAITTPSQKRVPLVPDEAKNKADKYKKPVKCVGKDKTLFFNSLKDAERNGFCRSAITKAIKNKKLYRGMVWEFIK